MCCLPIFLIAVNLQIINVDGILESNFLSVNSIFAGFLFTSLGIIAGILDKEIIVFLDERGYLDGYINGIRSEEHTSELQSRGHLVCRLLLEKKKKRI